MKQILMKVSLERCGSGAQFSSKIFHKYINSSKIFHKYTKSKELHTIRGYVIDFWKIQNRCHLTLKTSE